MVRKDVARVKQQAARLRTAAAVRQSARKHASIWQGTALNFKGFSR